MKQQVKIEPSTTEKLISWEAKRYKAYQDSVGVWTTGVGHAIFDHNESLNGVKLLNATLTDDQVNSLLIQDLYERTHSPQTIDLKINVLLNQDQFDSLILFCFNEGTIWNDLAFTINKDLSDENAIRNQWRKYCKAGGKILAGLVDRREFEIDLFFSKCKGRNYYDKARVKGGKLITGY